MPSITFLSGNTYSTTKTVEQRLMLKNSDGDYLDLSESFAEQIVVTTRRRQVEIPVIPYRSTMPMGGAYNLPMSLSMTLPIYSLDPVDVEGAIKEIEAFVEASASMMVDVYWLHDESGADPYYSVLQNCTFAEYGASRDYTFRRGRSSVEINWVSTSTKWLKIFPGDSAAPTYIHYGSAVYRAATGDGSPVLVVIRESDNQGLALFDDQGELRLLGSVKSNRTDAQMGVFTL